MVSMEWEVHKPNSRTEHALPNSNSDKIRQHKKHASMSERARFLQYHLSPGALFVCFTGLRNGVVVDVQ